ncbi:hypothetical protein RE6C_00008 [Rhodopirellula europaea 6C]|uniref:Uncharacterized protein n=1 Tax=Rhodopirellula europaea 6C TaxID=1263867 RepID=M2BAT5_9BACT|nr:hypothetical protein RE6C_00008 [Rhodopirellula europaea 6C]
MSSQLANATHSLAETLDRCGIRLVVSVSGVADLHHCSSVKCPV